MSWNTNFALKGSKGRSWVDPALNVHASQTGDPGRVVLEQTPWGAQLAANERAKREYERGLSPVVPETLRGRG